MDAAKDNRRSLDIDGIAGQFQTVAREISDFLNFTINIKVSQECRILLFFK